MADKKISQLTLATTPFTGSEELPIVQDSITKKTTIEDIKGYKVYTALLTQSGTSAPVPTVLENTIGNIVWSRFLQGRYFGTLTGAFTVDKTVVFASNVQSGGDAFFVRANPETVNTISLLSNNHDGSFADLDTELPMSIEIRVYN